jgi:hypothetical protein
MRKHCPIERLGLIVALSVLVAGCQQADQTLLFELAEGQGATLTIGTNGGIISVPPSFSLNRRHAGTLGERRELGRCGGWSGSGRRWLID